MCGSCELCRITAAHAKSASGEKPRLCADGFFLPVAARRMAPETGPRGSARGPAASGAPMSDFIT